ncbi:MAG: septum formation initiator family protein [Patescibacteria group bacterium]|nr:septum formation initiator family protein [Patescibacteria group bacterium]
MWQEILRFLKKQNRLTKGITILSIFILLILYSLIGIIYKNYTINKQMQTIKANMESLAANNIEQESKMLYYSTDAYTEKILREKLGYQKAGERVYALPRQDPERERLIREQQQYQQNEDKKLNILKWFEFFFVKKKI